MTKQAPDQAQDSDAQLDLMETQIDDWTSQIEDLEAKMQEADESTDSDRWKTLNGLRMKREKARELLRKLREAGAHADGLVLEEVQSTWQALTKDEE